MYIFLDESGDLGFDFLKEQTSSYFTITLLVCHTRDAFFSVQKASKRTLKNKLNQISKRSYSELKGYGTDLSIKYYFYRFLEDRDDISISTVILDKKRLKNELNNFNTHRLYKKLCFEAIQGCKFSAQTPFIHLIADRCMNKKDAQDFSASLQSDFEKFIGLNTKITIELKASSKDYGLQAVDMFSYGIFCKYESNENDWFLKFQSQIKSLIEI